MISEFPTREECVLADILAAQAAARPTRSTPSSRDDSGRSREAAQRAWELGNALIGEGVTPGESVCVWMPTSPTLLQTWFGINAAGAVYAPLNLAARGQFLQHALNVAGPRILVAHGGLVERLAGLDVPTLETIVVIGDIPDVELPWRVIAFAALTAGAAATRPALERPREPWDDFASSTPRGRPGPSKGVRLSYASHRALCRLLIWDDVGRGRQLPHAAADVPRRGDRPHVLDAAARRLGRPAGGFNARRSGTSPPPRAHHHRSSSTRWSSSCSTSRRPRTTPTTRCAYVYMGPLLRVQEFSRALRVGSTRASG